MTESGLKENVAFELWQRFAPVHHVGWANETHKAEYYSAAEGVLALIPAPAQRPCNCGVMCQDLGKEAGCRYMQPARRDLRKLVDVVYKHAADSVPMTLTADKLIDEVFGPDAAQMPQRLCAADESDLPKIPDDDSDFTPDLARKIIWKYQTIIGNLRRQINAEPQRSADKQSSSGEDRLADAYAVLRSIAQGNLGDATWQADYETIKQVARNALPEDERRRDEQNTGMTEELKGIFTCPICGQIAPHHHTAEEVKVAQVPTIAEIAADCREAAAHYRKSFTPWTTVSVETVAEIYDRIANVLDSHSSAETARATAWLIEWPEDDTNPVRWWNPAHGWMRDANKAMHFARKTDADCFLSTMRFGLSLKVTEHIFIGAEPSVAHWDRPVAGAIARGLAKRLPTEPQRVPDAPEAVCEYPDCGCRASVQDGKMVVDCRSRKDGGL
ncbi:hypothetical protein ACRQ5Q_15335 [Bradyrhizobium sp. PMVTL-01]|uniref:hypothetical protein n=1 Tax=Bradyrhizobium sp. PMVTL-01 TaxID=3434999 RepID=UPI003F71E2D5